jgi:hypothetical protein
VAGKKINVLNSRFSETGATQENVPVKLQVIPLEWVASGGLEFSGRTISRFSETGVFRLPSNFCFLFSAFRTAPPSSAFPLQPFPFSL